MLDMIDDDDDTYATIDKGIFSEGSTLLIDVGNSMVKWCWLAPDDPKIDNVPLHSFLHRGIDSDARQVSLCDAWQSSSPSTICVSSVADEAIVEDIEAVAHMLWKLPVHVAKTEANFGGMRTSYKNPSRLGVDRWLALLAAQKRYAGEACVVVDAGSAVTIDAISNLGTHLGGVIFPGFIRQYESLRNKTANLATFRDADPEDTEPTVMSCTTRSAIDMGVQSAIVGGVDRVVVDMYRQLKDEDSDVHLIITGGDAKVVSEKSGFTFEIRKKLVLEGLAIWLSTQTLNNATEISI